MIDILFLSSSDVEKVIDMGRVIELIEVVFREKGLKRVQMPPKQYLYFNKYDGDLRVMPAYIEFMDVAAVKIVNSHPTNPSKYGLPTVMAIIELVDPSTGRPLAIMDGTVITRYRTGAAVAIATKYLYWGKQAIVGLIGAGTMAYYIIEALNHIIKINELKVYDIVLDKAKKLTEVVRERFSIDTKAVDSPQKAVDGVDIIVTVTPSRKPIVMVDWVREGIHINAIGADAPGKQELDPKILLKAKIVVDDYEQAIHAGEVNVPITQRILKPENIYGELGEIIARLKKGRERPEEITVFTSTGLAIQDAITAWYVYQEAMKKGIGIKLTLIT